MIVGIDMLRDALGTVVVLCTILHNQLAEQLVLTCMGILHDLALEQALGEVAQMHHKPVKVQGVPVEMLLLELLHHRNGTLNEFRDVVHLTHLGIQFGIHNMQGDESGFVLVE